MKALDFIARAVIRFSAPVHKGKSLSSRASTRRQEPPSLSDQPVRPVPNAVNARQLAGKRGHRLRYNGKQLRNARRRAFEVTPLFMELYRFRAGSFKQVES